MLSIINKLSEIQKNFSEIYYSRNINSERETFSKYNRELSLIVNSINYSGVSSHEERTLMSLIEDCNYFKKELNRELNAAFANIFKL